MNKYGALISTVGLHEQRARMNLVHPQFNCVLSKRKGRITLVCRGEVQPTPLNGVYQTRIEYAVPLRPKIWIESPDLERRTPNERIPHTFADGRICLFKEDFRSDMHLATTVVPWLMLWLIFYEAWRVTDEWQGGGIHLMSHDTGQERAA